MNSFLLTLLPPRGFLGSLWLGVAADFPNMLGMSKQQGLEMIRGCRGREVVGGDVVEVATAYDTTANR